MALTPKEQDKIKKIEQEIEEKKALIESLKQKGAEDFAKEAMKLNLWKLDKKTAKQVLLEIAKTNNTLD